MAGRLSGLTEIYSLFGALDDDSKLELGERLTKIGEGVSAEQKAIVPQKSGNLASYIDTSEQAENLRVKSGLLTIKKGSGGGAGDWYGIVVEYGRRAGSKLVQRRRRVNGKLRLGKGRRKRAEDIATSYTIHWKALAPQPFIHINSSVQPIIDQNLDGFWDSVLARLGF